MLTTNVVHGYCSNFKIIHLNNTQTATNKHKIAFKSVNHCQGYTVVTLAA